MSGYRLAAPHGAWIDRSRPLRFAFNGRDVQGLAGDTVASALLAQGVLQVGRSFKLHRPRGIFSCGVEEPTGLLDIGTGAWRTPNTRATDILARDGLVAASVNCWPSLRFDLASANSKLARFLPAGFYYKTFMWPNWHWFEPAIRRLAGLGRAADAGDPERYDEVSVHAEVLVVGAGAAGMRAALSAAAEGRQVLLLEAGARPGGWLATQVLQEGGETTRQLEAMMGELAASRVELHTRCTALALYDHRLVTAIESFEDSGLAGPLRERFWRIRAEQIVLAVGAFERPMLFPDNDRPGVMLAGAVERYATHFGVACGHKVVIATSCDTAYGVAHSLAAAGIEVAAIVDRRARHEVGAGIRVPGATQLFQESVIFGVSGTRSVKAVQVASMDGRQSHSLDADLVASAGGSSPDVSLYSQAGGRLRWLPDASMYVPERSLRGVAVVGAGAGMFNLEAALAHADCAGRLPPGSAMPDARLTSPITYFGRTPADNRASPAVLLAAKRRPGPQFIDLQNDVTADDVGLAARENYRSVEHLKRYTTIGMATDQGKTSNVNALLAMGAATGRAPEQVGTTKFRPPFKPVTLNAMAGGRTGARHRPLKQLRAQAFHEARGALFEEFGGWYRPAAYPRPGETLAAAAEREAAAVRQGVGLFDGSPLGKIEIYGPDAAAFLDLMYVGTMSTLPVGAARYGVMLNENGVVVDDGIVARLGAQHFWVNTTSGGAERSVLAFEEWLQCEFVDLRVFVVPMSSQWGNVTVSGPDAWRLLDSAGFDEALSPAKMKHMSMRDSLFDGVALRVLRASFCGELGYEINVPSSRAQSLFERLWKAGGDFGVCAYGIEALMIMRIEKGFIHIGADTDGNTLPDDLGLARGVEKKAGNFVGRRSLARPASRDPDRMQLVGLLPVDRSTRLSVGAGLAAEPPPTRVEGFITSSCYSPALRQPVALAVLRGGRQRIGERLNAWHLGATIEAEVVTLPFFDPAGERLRG